MTGQYKDKLPDVSDSNQNAESTCNVKLKLTGIKDIFITEKTNQRWLYVTQWF